MKNLRLVAASTAIAAALSLAMASGAGALQTPTTGQPGAPTNTCGSTNFPTTPGQSATKQGSAFNPTGTAGSNYAGNTGTASLAHSNSTATVSQYDAACVQLSGH
jgi:hypothetical protein